MSSFIPISLREPVDFFKKKEKKPKIVEKRGHKSLYEE
jgi:hypothetical protein